MPCAFGENRRLGHRTFRGDLVWHGPYRNSWVTWFETDLGSVMPLRVGVSWDAEVTKVSFRLVNCALKLAITWHTSPYLAQWNIHIPHSVCDVILNPTHGMIPNSHMSFALKWEIFLGCCDAHAPKGPSVYRCIYYITIISLVVLNIFHFQPWKRNDLMMADFIYCSGALTQPPTWRICVFLIEKQWSLNHQVYIYIHISEIIKICCFSTNKVEPPKVD